MKSSIYIAIILSSYQELNLKRYISHVRLKEKLILLRFLDENIKGNKFSTNVKKINFKSKIFYLIYFCFIITIYSFTNKKFIFGNLDGFFCKFIRKFIDGENQIYVDDGSAILSSDYKTLKKNCTIFTNYKIKFPSTIKVIYSAYKFKKKIKKKCDKVMFIGSSLVKDKVLSKNQFLEIMKIISSKEKKFYYFPHRREKIELSLLPKNFKIIPRKSNVEKFIFNYKYNFKLIYSFRSSCIIEVLNFYKSQNLRIFDYRRYLDNSNENLEKKKRIDDYFNYLKKYKIKIFN